MIVIAYTCPVHGLLAEWNAPGPEKPPKRCDKYLRLAPGVFICPPPRCGQTLERSEREEA